MARALCPALRSIPAWLRYLDQRALVRIRHHHAGLSGLARAVARGSGQAHRLWQCRAAVRRENRLRRRGRSRPQAAGRCAGRAVDAGRAEDHDRSTIQNKPARHERGSAGAAYDREECMDDVERRAFMKGAGLGALAFTVGGAEVLLTPRQARALGVSLRTLTAEQAATLEAVGETLVPGAKQAGIVNFVDQQISIPAEEALLEARILNVRPPYANFYRAALGAIDRSSQARNGGKTFAQLAEAEQRSLIDNMRQNKIEGWQ